MYKAGAHKNKKRALAQRTNERGFLRIANEAVHETIGGVTAERLGVCALRKKVCLCAFWKTQIMVIT